MRKLSYRIIVFTFIGFIIAAVVPRILLVAIFGENFITTQSNDPFIVGTLSALIIYILFYSLVIHRIVIKRVNALSDATQQVKDGNFDFALEDKAHDEIARLTDNFNAMTQGLKSNEYLSRDFVKNFSHEFKTPLAVIKGYAELIGDTNTSSKDKKSYLNFILHEVDRLSHMAHNILEISLLEDTSRPLQKTTFNLGDMVKKIEKDLSIKASQKNVSFTLEMDELIINTNENLMYQALLNLMDNAVKFSDPNTVILVELNASNPQQFKITNLGPSIPKEDHDKIFNLFYTLSNQTDSNSTGVGLTLVNKIIQRLGHSIQFSSENNQTTFIITLH